MKFYWEVLKESVGRFAEEDMPTHAAALSYYMIFSLPSMLLIILWVAAAFYREVAVREAIFAELGTLVGQDGARQVMATLEKVSVQETSWWATVAGLMALLFFASTVYDAMRTALSRVAQSESPESPGQSLWRMVRIRIVGVALLAGISFLMTVFLVLDAIITRIETYLAQWLGESASLVAVLDGYILNLGATTVLFAMYFRYLPDVKLNWRDIWLGALLTALLFVVGKFLISLFIGDSDAADLYDAAGSILVLMLWVYYAAFIFLFGAAFTFVRAERFSTGSSAPSG